MSILRDKNGCQLKEGLPVRLTQTSADLQNANRIYYLVEQHGELVLCIPLSAFQNESSEYHSLETVR
jgi:hypothetical protein